MSEEMETIIMNLIVDAGSAKSYAMEAIRLAKEGSFTEADEFLENANSELAKAHHTQTDLIQQAAKGEEIEINLFMVHAQDHIMTSMLAKDLAAEIVELHRMLYAQVSRDTFSSFDAV
ncbi:MAG: PTS lactose/cellobiose transporter subunit IIA [Oscillospiraceae bacterium]|nr:PTS lactose/cellobiose transporter subunit IIA [Oscillospiraceae bacterium]